MDRVESTAEVTQLCRRAAVDPLIALQPQVLRDLRCTTLQVVGHGEHWPIEVEDESRPDGRFAVTEVDSAGVPRAHTAHDALSAAVLSPSDQLHELQIVRTTTYRPIGRQSTILPFLDVRRDVRLDLTEDPAVALVEYRRKAKERGDLTLAAVLRVLVNALVYGNFCRFDPVRRKVNGVWSTWERPGPWACMPIASTVTAGSRLLLCVLERMVRDLGGLVLYRDTDSSILPATRAGVGNWSSRAIPPFDAFPSTKSTVSSPRSIRSPRRPGGRSGRS